MHIPTDISKPRNLWHDMKESGKERREKKGRTASSSTKVNQRYNAKEKRGTAGDG